MGRAPNPFKPQPLTLQATAPTRRYLERLVAIGLYGDTPNEVAKNLLLERLRQLIEEGKLVELPPMNTEREKQKG